MKKLGQLKSDLILKRKRSQRKILQYQREMIIAEKEYEQYFQKIKLLNGDGLNQ